MIDHRRHEEWVRLSHRTNRFETFMVVAVQGLGKLDAMLTAQDASYLQLPHRERESIEQSTLITDRFTSSYLWCSALMRLFEQSINAAAKVRHPLTRQRLNSFETRSMPLNSETDSTVAFPALHLEHGIAWNVAQDVFVTRRELSEGFMTMLRALQ